MLLIAILTAVLCTAFLCEVLTGTSASASLPHIGFETICAGKHLIVVHEFFTGVVPMTCLLLGACLLFEHSSAGLGCIISGGIGLFLKLTRKNVAIQYSSTETLRQGMPSTPFLHGGD